jgi:lipopolysaccharide/colanic/teichoic acid biosynthesis glycosyltransferase
MALSASTDFPHEDVTHFRHEDVASLWQERRPVFTPPAAIRDERSRLLHGHRRRHAALSEPSRSGAKRMMDLVGASLALLFLAPLLGIIALVIKLSSPGPVLFSQYRYGHRNHRFRIYKFRTMHIHLTDLRGTRQTTDDDPRVTRFGRFLRHTSLDELPQLINVVKGDMSLVGPRPHVPGMLAAGVLYEDLVPYYFQRHAVRPGITGLAQVSGCRGSTTDPAAAISRLDYDLEYIETWSLWLDARILIRTAIDEFLSGSGI